MIDFIKLQWVKFQIRLMSDENLYMIYDHVNHIRKEEAPKRTTGLERLRILLFNEIIRRAG